MYNMNSGFAEMSVNEQLDVEGGVIGTICAVIGTALAIGTAVYGYGYAKGQQAGYRAKYGN